MFKRVVTHKGFWKSVLFLGMLYFGVFLLVQCVAYPFEYIVAKLKTISFVLVLSLASAIAAFFSTYAKFWAKLKEGDFRNKK